jgi:hypothetical protein
MATATALPANVSRTDIHAALVKKGTITILDLLDRLAWFRGAPDWTAWRVFLKGVYALPMTQAEARIFRKYTGRKDPPEHEVKEVYCAVGRRGRKSAIGATIGVFEATCRDHTSHTAPEERAIALVMSKDKDDAQQIQRYAAAILSDQALSHLVMEETADEIRLKNYVDFKIRAATITGGRSRTIITALLDEIAFFPMVGMANPDLDIIRGIRPAMATCPTSKLFAMSSPYAQQGVLFEKFEELWGNDQVQDAFFWKAGTLDMQDTPAVRVFVEGEYKTDPVSADAECGANFRTDVQIFISREVVKAAVPRGVHGLAPCSMDPVPAGEEQPTRHHYFGFVDTSGGSIDSFTISIAHWDHERKKAVLDWVQEWIPPFSPGKVTKEACEVLKTYYLAQVYGDAYAGEWPRDRFAENRVGYNVSQKTKHDIYKDILPCLNTAQVELLDNEKLVSQLLRLQRRVTPLGKDIIDHPKNEHDDLINAAAGALLLAYDIGRFMSKEIKLVAPPKSTQEIQDRELQDIIDEMAGEKERREPGDLPMTVYSEQWEE